MADDGDTNVIDFPRIGFTPPGGAGSGPAFTGPPDGIPEAPAQPEAEPDQPPVRQSPLEALAALAMPARPLPTDAPVPLSATSGEAASTGTPQPGFVPETFRGPGFEDTSQMESAGLGALSMAAVLAVAVAALRGIHTAVTNRRATREQRQAVADAARKGRRNSNASGAGGSGGSGGGGGRRHIPSSQEWARRSLHRTGPSGGRGAGGGTWLNRRNNGGGSNGPKPGGRNESPGRRRNNGPGGTRSPGLLRRSGTDTRRRGDGGRKDRDRARRERLGGVHKTTQAGDAGSRLRLRRRTNTGPKGGPDLADGSKRGPGAKRRPGRRKSPAGTTGPKGTLRSPKNSPRRDGKANLNKKNASGPKNKTPSPGGKTKSTGKAGGPQRRVTFGQAITAEAERRLRKRRGHMTPAIAVSKKKRKKSKTGPGKPGATSATTSTSTGPSTAKAGKMKWERGRQGPARPGRRTSPWDNARRRIWSRWAKRRAAWNTGGGTYAGPPFSGGGRRRSPFEAAGMAAGAAYGTTWTVERIDNPGDQERRWEPRPRGARAAAGAIPPPRPAAPGGSTSPDAAGAPTSTKGGGMTLPANTTPGFNLAPSMSAEHTTEVTLDDTLEVLEKLTQESFGAHDESVRLAAKAKELRAALEDLAADLQSRHNVIGRLTGRAMALLAESMDVLARKAEQMAVSSLAAAELSEASEQAMFDAYKPVQQATADAGLAVPSARVHNEG